MQIINQENIERLDRLATSFNCELCLPPYKGTNHVFLPIGHLNDKEHFDLAWEMTEKGFFIICEDNDDIMEIIGADDE